jgi:Rieske Fe-S protein
VTEQVAPRRAVLAFGAAGAAGVLAGCQVYGREPAPAAPAPGTGAGDGGSGTGDGGSGDGTGDGTGGTVVARTGEVAVGGGLILGDHQIVVTQPAAGTFRAFSAVCTHQGCRVTSVSDGTINCACHGSRFSIEDGSVVQPAAGLSADQQDPLPEATIVVDGDAIALG